ncbi:hypothetical protein [Erythrobacter sp. A6_0]|uniref:hypothetical protein n=1 Tax=Erythrobacter sp. A6_0 TaxID=2821089 RepID=UPI0032AF90F0
MQIAVGHGFHALDRFNIGVADQFLTPQADREDHADLSKMNKQIGRGQTIVQNFGDDRHCRQRDQYTDHDIELAPHGGVPAEPGEHSGISFAIATE